MVVIVAALVAAPEIVVILALLHTFLTEITSGLARLVAKNALFGI